YLPLDTNGTILPKACPAASEERSGLRIGWRYRFHKTANYAAMFAERQHRQRQHVVSLLPMLRKVCYKVEIWHAQYVLRKTFGTIPPQFTQREAKQAWNVSP